MTDHQRLWRPPLTPVAEHDPVSDLEPREDDKYWVVDDIDMGMAHIAASAWPSIDRSGRLEFRTAGSDEDEEAFDESFKVPLLEMQDFVSGQRAQHGQLAADRPLRIGDVFWCRLSVDTEGTGFVAQLLDVTYGARQETKASQKWAITSTSGTSEPDRQSEKFRSVTDLVGGPEADASDESPEDPPKPAVSGSTASPSI
ncbi:MAG: hypothetical protein IH943_12035 [Acidobacteria bacterium]|nr:hypothetical protein [Acidobacteriota bacterium]